MTADNFDIVIVGAGLSGIGMACRLQDKCPGKSYVVLEGRDSMGGTWDLFRYPGVRSDSDMFTLGYEFKPWDGDKDIADGASILRYIRQTAEEHNVDRHIRYRHQVTRVTWSTEDAAWTVEAEQGSTGQTVVIRCNMLLVCAGYYSYKTGYTPKFEGRDRFQGEIIHPQKWPEGLDYGGKRVVIIGSGATAVTLAPAMAEKAAHVVVLQRSPSYLMTRPSRSRLAGLLRKTLPSRLAYALTRWWNSWLSGYFYRKTRSSPEKTRKLLLAGVRQQLGDDFDIEKHFSPTYNPWDQRLCLVPDGDFFEAIRSGKVSMVTDHIDRFTEHGILLKSGEQLDADLIVTATGLRMQMLGGAGVVVDGSPVRFSKVFTYKGIMYSDVPNLVVTFGYINASWTLRADLIAEFACRLINHMDQVGMRQCTPRLSELEQQMQPRPFIQDFSSNYIRRLLRRMPKQGDREPWVNTQDYRRERKLIGRASLEDGSLVFDNPRT